MHPQRSTPGLRALGIYLICTILVSTAVPVMVLVRAADQTIDLDKNAANGAESKISTKVLQTYPVKVENTVYNNAAGGSFSFVWPGAGPGGFSSFVTAGPGVGTKWVWSTVYQVYSIESPVTFNPTRTLSTFGAPTQGVQAPGSGSGGSFPAPGKSINPSSVTLSDASLSSSLITFFSPEKTVATCGFKCAPGECELFLENNSGAAATITTEQLGCCPEPNHLICDGTCTAYLTDVENCGGCGNVCASDEICSDGVCACPSGLDQCGSGCVDLMSDPANCGACGSVCASDEFCGGGACVCNSGLDQCGDGCVDLTFDPLNCGACGNACPVGGFCADGGCACPAGQTACGGTCVDLTSDPLNCGACGNTCGPDSICTGGACSACRPPRATACDNQCVSLHTDPFNCGSCGNVCDFSNCPSTGQGTCSQGSSCVCSPAPTSSTGASQIRFAPLQRSAPEVRSDSATARSRASFTLPETDSGSTVAAAPHTTTLASAVSAPSVVEAPVCDLAPIEQTIPSGGVYSQIERGGRFGKEIQTTVTISVDGRTIAQGPCSQVVPVTDVDTSGVILSPVSVATKDASGDGLCQPGEAWCEYRITVAGLGDTACLNPLATLSSAPDAFNPNEVTFLNATSAYPSVPGYPGDGVPLDRLTNSTAFSINTTSDQPPDVGRPFLMSVSCAGLPAAVEVPITLGIGSACQPGDIDGATFDRLDGFQSPVRAPLVVQGNPVNYSSGSFNLGSTIPLKLALSCGSQVLTDAQIEPNPEIVALDHENLGPQSLIGINGDNGANPDDPEFSCTDSGCDYQFRTNPLPAGRYIISVRMPDTRIFQAGFTISP